MSVRHVYDLTVLSGVDSEECLASCCFMTIVSNAKGETIRCRSEAEAVARALVAGEVEFILEQRFVLYQTDGSLFYFPDLGNQFVSASRYPIEIACGFIVSEADGETDLLKSRASPIPRAPANRWN